MLNCKSLNKVMTCVDKYIKKFKLFVIASNVGNFERWKVLKFMSGLKREIAE